MEIKKNNGCPIFNKCGSCQFQCAYEEQLIEKQRSVDKLLSPYGKVLPILGAKAPMYYRNKVHHVFSRDRKGNILDGFFQEESHKVVMTDQCLLEDLKSQEIIKTIRGMLKSFKILVYDEDTEYGLLRHVLVRRGFCSGEIMVVLVVASPIFPSKNNFVKALLKVHPEIKTVVLNVNDRKTSMVLGKRNIVLFGPGFIKDTLCGKTYRISPDSFYQINSAQTEVLYQTAIDFANLSKDDVVIDAYSGIGTIGLTAADFCKQVIGVELNPEAVKDAVANAKENKVGNVVFFCNDAGKFMVQMAEKKEHVDVVFMDPPRSGSTEEFMQCVRKLGPSKVVYISCNPETQARDLHYFTHIGYKVMKIQPVDMFPGTRHVETVALLSRTAK